MTRRRNPTSARLRAFAPLLKAAACAPGDQQQPGKSASGETPARARQRGTDRSDAKAERKPRHRPLIHVPLYCPPGVTAETRVYMLELLFACLESYFAHDNKHVLLVTTNDHTVREVVGRYRTNSGARFELMLVSAEELVQAFRTEPRRLLDEPCAKMLFSKFYPILRRFADQIVHVDFDTLFTSRVEFAPLFAADVGLVDANGFPGRRPWAPNREQAAFFRLLPLQQLPSWNWANSGVFSVQRGGFDLCRSEIEHYLRNLERANEIRINVYPDEIILNALLLREQSRATLIRDPSYNFIAYHLKYDPNWRRSCRILHFHSLKPHVFRFAYGGVQQPNDAKGRISDDFYLAVLMWCRYLHAASHKQPLDLPMTRDMPLDVVNREFGRLSALVEGIRDARSSAQRCSP